jgi:hypothetical protein
MYNSTIESELPSDMRFNSAHVISIVGYGSLFVVSSIANLVSVKMLMVLLSLMLLLSFLLL